MWISLGNWTNWFTGLLAALMGLWAALFGAGCAPKSTELERFSDQIMNGVIAPAVEQALAETATRTATLQGGAQAIEPGYRVEVEGFFGTGVKAMTIVRVIGVSGQITGHAQGDQGPDLENRSPEPPKTGNADDGGAVTGAMPPPG